MSTESGAGVGDVFSEVAISVAGQTSIVMSILQAPIDKREHYRSLSRRGAGAEATMKPRTTIGAGYANRTSAGRPHPRTETRYALADVATFEFIWTCRKYTRRDGALLDLRRKRSRRQTDHGGRLVVICLVKYGERFPQQDFDALYLNIADHHETLLFSWRLRQLIVSAVN